jgi:hypothetical protein
MIWFFLIGIIQKVTFIKMGIYHWYELGVWFESQLSMEDIRKLLPKNAKIELVKNQYFLPCLQANDSRLRGFDGRVSEDDKKKLLLLWKHIKQSEGLQAKQIACRYHYDSTYEIETDIINIPIKNIEYEV